MIRTTKPNVLLALGLTLAIAAACTSADSGDPNDGDDQAGGSGADGGGSGEGGGGGRAKGGSGGSKLGGSGGGGSGGDDGFGFAGAAGSDAGGAAGSAGAGGAMLPPPPAYVGPLFDFENGTMPTWGDARAGKAKLSVDETQAHGGKKSLRLDFVFDPVTQTAQTEWFPGWGPGAVNKSKQGIPCWVDKQLVAWVRLSANWPINAWQAVYHDDKFAWESENVSAPAMRETWFMAKWKKLDPMTMPIRDNDNGFLHIGFYMNGIMSTQPATYTMWIDDVACVEP